MFNFQVSKALDSTYSCLIHQLQNYCKATAISSWHLVKYIGKGNLYLGPFK